MKDRIQRLRILANSPTVTESESHDIHFAVTLMERAEAWDRAKTYEDRHNAYRALADHLRGKSVASVIYESALS